VKEFQEGDIIAVFMEHRAASVATIQDVVTIAALRGSTGAWHKGIIDGTERLSSEKVECPLFFFPLFFLNFLLPSGSNEQSLDVLKKPLARRSVEGTY